ncbi:MAG: hypothetical protein NT126_06425 [Bacteroidetes bacterium]|nr:hypothetical protein [Bacteroidota bacterium]
MYSAKQNNIRKWIAWFLLAAVSFFVTPTELIHQLTDHDDTFDLIAHSETSTHVEALHQHCDMLQFSVPPMFHEANIFTLHTSVIPVSVSTGTSCDYFYSSSPFLFFRGPPVV